MWALYVLMSMLTAGVVIKLVNPLLGRGRFAHIDIAAKTAVTKADRSLVGVLLMIVPVATLSLYLMGGRPDLPGHPAIFYDLEAMGQRHLSLLAERPMQILLEKDADDIGALKMLGKINTDLGNHAEAAKFYSHLVRSAVMQDDPYVRLYAVALGESQILANNNTVGDDAVATFHFVQTIYPESPLARHYLALRKFQQGDVETAVSEWMQLLNEGPTRSYWKEMVRDQLALARAALQKKED